MWKILHKVQIYTFPVNCPNDKKQQKDIYPTYSFL